VLACEGSRVAGQLVSPPRSEDTFDTRVHAEAARRHRRVLETILARQSVDLLHFHGHDFDMYLPPDGPPALATLHLPPELLIAHLTELRRPDTWVHGVSQTQHARLPRVPCLLPPIENGVEVDELPRTTRRRNFALFIGRICPEKGVHLAVEAALLADVPIFIGGALFPYDEHRRYFEHHVQPHLGRRSRFIGRASSLRKRLLLSAARCVLVPSLVEETSSLLAMEALSCGTPVVAFARGALPELVQHGVTGFIVNTVAEMAAAIRRVDEIDPEACRDAARARFSATRMVDQYLDRYEEILSWPRNRTPCIRLAHRMRKVGHGTTVNPS
jgi:glycosyltransferase involved in cell wall biosynthesis